MESHSKDKRSNTNSNRMSLIPVGTQTITNLPPKLSRRRGSSFHSKNNSFIKFKTREPDYEGMIHAFLLEKYIALGTMNYMDKEEPKEDDSSFSKNQ